ncbi:type III restriction enzyme, res subunit [bacterium BMS3Bbin08]|nr:type III restriction enzyme, res subunit [bacterium BMS3Bbin08]
MANGQTLVEKLHSVSQLGFLKQYKVLPEYIVNNLNQRFSIREYQQEAIARLIYYLTDYPDKTLPIHLLCNMATGSGKTFLMASNILYLYKLGYRHFIFFVNSRTIIKKTKANFLDKSSPKYLFAEKVVFNDKEINIQEVDNFEGINPDNINILFTTIQGLHSRIWTPQENAITLEDFKNKKIVFLSDEAHHINALTKNFAKMTKDEREESTSWENTVNKIFQSESENIMLEYTATIDLSDKAIRTKYEDKIVYQYTLKEFREDKFSKDIQILQSDLNIMERALQAVILSQYRRKVAEKYKIQLKPVILVKSQRTIAQSEVAEYKFKEMIRKLKVSDIKKIEKSSSNGIINMAFKFFKKNGITYENLVREIKSDFSEEKCIAVNSKADSEEKQIKVNTLESEHNETRVIFTVNMLNEGWDVLNLYDIVRLYETRDTRHSKAGGTTISEAQLIGRGARYFPFVIKGDQDKFKRKYDEDINNELRVLEELHYHSLNDSRYINEIKAELVKSGISPPDDRRKQITVSIKDHIKKTMFWKDGLLFLNEKKENSREKVKQMCDLISETIFKHKLRIGKTTEISVFDEAAENGSQYQDIIQHTIKFNQIEKHINRKALDKVDFYRFINLQRYFPSLNSIDEFLTSDDYLGEVDVEIYGLKERLDNLNHHDKYEIALDVFKELANKIESSTSEYIGTKEFKGHNICKVVESSRTGEVLIGGEDKEFGIAMSYTSRDDLRLHLKNHDWYMYDENYGTSEEKYFIQFVRHAIEEIKKKCSDIYLLRNEQVFKIYRFSDGKAFAPDFVLFLTEKDTKTSLSLQLFVEPKGQHLIKSDQWKEEFLNEIEKHFKIHTLFESAKYRLIGLPFYNEAVKKQEFTAAFDRVIKASLAWVEKSDLFFSDVIPNADMPKKDKYSTHLPVFSLQAVATVFSEEQKPELLGWKMMNIGKKLDKYMFIAKVVGRSMEPTIPDGSYCIFRFDQGGSRNGLVVLVESRQVADPETNQKFTVKRYKSEKKTLEGDQWRHKKIILSPDNKNFDDIVLENVSGEDFKVIAEFVGVLE